MFGFDQTEFRGMERGERYAVEVGFLSGGSSSVVIATISLNLGTAGNNKYHKFHVYTCIIANTFLRKKSYSVDLFL